VQDEPISAKKEIISAKRTQWSIGTGKNIMDSLFESPQFEWFDMRLEIMTDATEGDLRNTPNREIAHHSIICFQIMNHLSCNNSIGRAASKVLIE
jgi:hypothetical protein